MDQTATLEHVTLQLNALLAEEQSRGVVQVDTEYVAHVIVLQTCGNASSENCTYFQNPGFPSTYDVAQTCSIFVSKKDPNICQYKLDLLTFDITPPVSGECVMDMFSISGQNTNSGFPPLCGLNSGQTFYTDVSSSQGPIILSMTTAGSRARSWNIKITQIRCDDPSRAPDNCLQYFTGASGSIKSINYATTGAVADTGYLNDLRYNICIRKEMGFCDISYTNPAGMTFSIDADPTAVGAGVGDAECTQDFLIIESERYCADFLNTDTTATADGAIPDTTNGPFMVEFMSDGATNARGFMLDYTQMACATG
ncbi:hypothetical protein GQR58_005415 [Nymphon striatum]|nr:hypothetical protein GQR58_005415 [Nymphon striatum]